MNHNFDTGLVFFGGLAALCLFWLLVALCEVVPTLCAVLLHNGFENYAPNDYLWSKLQEKSFIGDFPLPNGRNPQPTSEYGQQNSGDDGSNLPSDGKPTLWGWIVIVIGVGISGAGGWFGTWLILVRKYWTGGLLMLGSAGLTFLCWLWAS